MAQFFMGNSLWQLVNQSDTISKGVMLLLFVMSAVSWSLFVFKLIFTGIKKRQMADALKKIGTIKNLDQLLAFTSDYSGKLPGHFLSRNLHFLKGILQKNEATNEMNLTQQQWELVQQNAAQTIDDTVYQEESYLLVLQTIYGVAPLLGLFGTVWGLVHAFIRISQKQSADIATVAPGIAEALLTTLAGLIVAIPAFVIYNVLRARVRLLEQKMVSLGDRYVLVLHQLFCSVPTDFSIRSSDEKISSQTTL